jgi:uncharacterized membrane-anchored protein
MKNAELRDWLGKYFLMITGVLGAYVLLLGETALLPVTKEDALDVFQIIVPVLVGQLTLIFRWFGENVQAPSEEIAFVPPWVVKGPPLMVAGILTLSIGAMVVGNFVEATWTVSPQQFKALVTFCVTILNATTVYIVTSYFRSKPAGKRSKVPPTLPADPHNGEGAS